MLPAKSMLPDYPISTGYSLHSAPLLCFLLDQHKARLSHCFQCGDCHHPLSELLEEKVQFNKSRRTICKACVFDHQHFSRTLIFPSRDSIQPHQFWWIFYIFWAGGCWWGGFRQILWFLCGAALFKLRNQRPPMCYISYVVQRKGRSTDTHLKSWFDPIESILVDGDRAQLNTMINFCTCHTLRQHQQHLSSCFIIASTFLFSQFPSFIFLPGRQD